ncbi:MAG: PmoA family protein [Bacteroidetes bacterium]|nr:PmoA family protein [Bacteroidota bacterium]MDE2672655.1 PmoA family protein [Bacteroidota bacterium]
MNTRRFHFSQRLILLFTLVFSACGGEVLLTFETAGGDQLRPLAIVTFEADLDKGTYIAHDHTGKRADLQVDGDGRATFLMSRALPGATTRWTVRLGQDATPKVEAATRGDAVLIRAGGRDVVAYRTEKRVVPREDIPEVYNRDGYLHPVWSPSGRVITDDYPPDHIHHHGIWAAWTNTIFQGRTPDFWNMGRATGRVEVIALDSIWSGVAHAGLNARHRYVDMIEEEVAALNETWHLKVYRTPTDINILDLSLTQIVATGDTLVLPEYRYGGVGVRGHRDWVGEEGAEFFTSEGLTRENGHATRARWCHIGGIVDGERVGIAVLSHPDNHESPQPMRIHPTEPFFNFAPTQAGQFEITSDEQTTWKYRFVTYDGAYDQDLLDALWEDYANPLTVHIVR